MSLIMHSPLPYNDDSGSLYQNLQMCNCCPYGYHIDLDFVRYCESLVNAKPSDGELLRRDRRLSRKSMEVMLGLESLYLQWEASLIQPVQEAQIEIEPESPRVVNIAQDYSYYLLDESSPQSATTNSSPETSAFLRDALDEVVSDFERTLERTKKKDKRSSSWGHYVYVNESCVSGNKSPQLKNDELPPTQEKEDVDSVGSRKSDAGAHALCNIREQMAISLNKMKDLEEQVKNIPVLQRQLAALKEEKRQLQQKLQKEEAFSRSLAKHRSAAFTPQRINPVFLESLGSRIQSKPSPLDLPKKSIKRDVGVMCTQHTRDIGTLASPAMVRSVGINSTNTNGIHDELYTKQDLDNIIQLSIRNHEEKLQAIKRKKLVSIGTQIVAKPQNDVKHICIQTNPIKEVYTKSQGIMAYPSLRDAIVDCKPETRTIGSSEHKLNDKICDKCSAATRTVGCGPEVAEVKNSLSLKLMDLPPRSVSFSLGESEKLNIKRKTIGTQYQISVQNKAIQSSIQMTTVGIQNSVISVTKSSQYAVDNSPRSTDTNDLIRFVDNSVNTDEHKEKRVVTRDNFANTDIIRTKEIGLNAMQLSPRLKHTSSNTENILRKDVSCGDIIKPHISIACAENYCDSCKDAIKNLAKDFTKILASPVLGNISERTRIPRPTTVTSPRPARKPLMRQNTYTIPSPTLSTSPTVEQSPSSIITEKVLSGSLDSVNFVESPTSVKRINDESSSSKSRLEEMPSSSSNKESLLFMEEKQDNAWNQVDPSCPLVNGEDNNESKQEQKLSPSSSPVPIDSSQKLQRNSMLFNEIATSISEPRTKVTPSKEMKAAMKVLNDSLHKSSSNAKNLKSANTIIQTEWFSVSSMDQANPLDVEDYLDCFEEYSNSVLKYIVNLIDSNGNTAMHYAVSHGNFDIVSILLDSKVCNVNQTNNAGYTCVMLVSLAKLKNSAHRTVVQRLFQMADVNIRAKKHCQTALMLAVSHGNFDMVEMLLSAGADINIQDEDGSTALMCAAEHGHINIVKHLLSQPDCDSLIQDVDGSTAFKIAWQAGHRDIGLLLYVHEQMLRSKMPSSKMDQRSPATPRRQKPQQQSQ